MKNFKVELTINPRSVFSFVLIFLSSCSLEPLTPSVKVRVALNESKRTQYAPESSRSGTPIKPNSKSNFQCYFVSISGSGINPRYRLPSELSGLDPLCSQLNLGAVSNLVTATELASGVNISVPSGNNRKIQVFGVNSNLGTSCSGQKLDNVFGPIFWGSLYEVGNQTQDLLIGQDVTMGAATFSSQSNDLAARCGSRAVLPLTAVYHNANVNTSTSPTLPPLSNGVMSYTFLGLGRNLSFPLSKSNLGGAQTRQSLHFVFSPPDTNKELNSYRGVRIYSTNAVLQTGNGSTGSCTNLVSGSGLTFAVHPFNGAAPVGTTTTPVFDTISGGDGTPTSLTNLLQPLAEDSSNSVPLGKYLHLTIFSDPSELPVCPGLVVHDLLAVAFE